MMTLSPKNRARTKHHQGPGGRYCPCCDHRPKDNAKIRRYIRRTNKQSWKKENHT